MMPSAARYDRCLDVIGQLFVARDKFPSAPPGMLADKLYEARIALEIGQRVVGTTIQRTATTALAPREQGPSPCPCSQAHLISTPSDKNQLRLLRITLERGSRPRALEHFCVSW
jgi:hypothetical protein